MSRLCALIAAQTSDRRLRIRDILRETANDSLLIVEAQDGVDACNRASRQFFNFMVIDQELDKRSGIESLRTIQALPKELRPASNFLLLADEREMYLISSLKDLSVEGCGPEKADENVRSWFQRKMQPVTKNQTPAFDAKMVNTFIESTLEVLRTTAQISSSKEKIFIRNANMPSGDISAVMQILSSRQCGSMAISFETSCFLAVVNGMLGEKYSEVSPEILDAAAELCSQIFGHAKRTLNENGYEIKPAIPSIISEANHCVEHRATGPCVAVRFSTSAGYFTVEASLDRAV